MSNSTPLVPLTAAMMIAASVGAGWTGYVYNKNTVADAYYLAEASELRSSALQAIYLSQRAATDSTLADELDRLDTSIETSFNRVLNGDPINGIAPASQALSTQVRVLQDNWSKISASLAKIIGSKSTTDSFTRARFDTRKALAACLNDAEDGLTRYTQIGGSAAQLSTLKSAVDSLREAAAIINRESVDGETIRSADAGISEYLGSVSAIARSIPKDKELFDTLGNSYRGAQAAQRQVARMIDAESGASANLPYAREVWAERDRINAASATLVDYAKTLPATHVIQPVIVAALGALAVLMALITSIVAQRSAASRTQAVEDRGNHIMGSQKERSKELTLLLNDINTFGTGHIDHLVAADRDSTKDIAKVLNDVFGKIRAIIQESDQTIAGLAAATEQTLMTARNVDRNRQEQLRALEHISGMIQALSNYIGQVQDMTSNTVTVAKDVASKVRTGSDAVREVHEGILLLSETNTGIQHRSKSMIESFQSLERISAVVTQVAERSDLVAWNAHLVADEVDGSNEVTRAMSKAAEAIGVLAGQCRKAVGEIEVVLKSMNEAARETQHAVDSSQREIDGLLNRSNNAQTALSDISQMSTSLSQSVADVTNSTQALRSQASDMTSTMDTVLHYSSENAAASEQTAQAVMNVNRSAQGLLNVIQGFIKGH
jgi:twitching motility protein PilJ